MAKILSLPVQPPTKLGFARVKKATRNRKKKLENHGQLNLFAAQTSAPAHIVPLPHKPARPFEQALLLDEHDDPAAASAYRKAISAGDSVPDAYCNLGILEFKAGKTDRAFHCFTESLKADPRHMESHYNLGNLYFEHGEHRLAKLHYEIAAQIAPNFPNVYFNLGLVLAMQEDFESAAKALQKYTELAPKPEARRARELLAELQESLKAPRRRN